MKIGFTGTRHGMSDNQCEKFAEIVNGLHSNKIKKEWPYVPQGIGEFHHGDCKGADFDAHKAVHRLTAHPQIIIHPPKVRRHRAFCVGGKVLPEQEYFDRNHAIVRDCEMLIACPAEFEEKLRSGTWATIRYARKAHKPVIIIYPNGTVSKEENEA